MRSQKQVKRFWVLLSAMPNIDKKMFDVFTANPPIFWRIFILICSNALKLPLNLTKPLKFGIISLINK